MIIPLVAKRRLGFRFTQYMIWSLMFKSRQNPEDFLDKVKDEKTFLEFLHILSMDWEKERQIEETNPSSPYGSGAMGWENGTIGDFLERAYACGTAHLKSGGLEPDSNVWKKAASIIYSGKIYE